MKDNLVDMMKRGKGVRVPVNAQIIQPERTEQARIKPSVDRLTGQILAIVRAWQAE